MKKLKGEFIKDLRNTAHPFEGTNWLSHFRARLVKYCIPKCLITSSVPQEMINQIIGIQSWSLSRRQTLSAIFVCNFKSYIER